MGVHWKHAGGYYGIRINKVCLKIKGVIGSEYFIYAANSPMATELVQD